MIDNNRIIKIKDYLDIIELTSSRVVLSNATKTFTVKGYNYTKYIYPIIDLLCKPVSISFLIKNIQERQILNDINIDDFVNMLLTLIDKGILEDYKNIDYGEKIVTSKNKKIIVLSYLDKLSCKYILENLITYREMNISLIDFGSNVKVTDFNDNIRSKISIVNMLSLNYDNLEQYVNGDYFIIVMQSARNKKLNLTLNAFFYKHNKCWINCVINDLIIELGPLIIPGKTACLQCSVPNLYDYMNKTLVRQYKITNIVNLIIFVGLILEEIDNYFSMKSSSSLPNTINNIIKFSSINDEFVIKRILKNPQCKICSKFKNESRCTNDFR
ncbi:hypothetical protein [Inconstantimicrobium porci]|uniref:Uncharacterized protein n=1 Tax=Inconstantimicrobium porci TaxID=2652291 RepID=A0A7X2MZJ2_9CLOT|nr:hypothetical protein [Inconstantimicrobium porci]MDD6771827.1 hypothetical protein [Inconstantimicrobium porci]MSR91974.1 hypothetical protein [Inconstantimicrobium porci]